MLPAGRPSGGRGVCRISARSTLTRALPSSESERDNRSRLASERAASGEIFRRAPRAPYVSVSTDIGCSPRGGGPAQIVRRNHAVPPVTGQAACMSAALDVGTQVQEQTQIIATARPEVIIRSHRWHARGFFGGWVDGRV